LRSQDLNEGFLWNVDLAYAFHPFLALHAVLRTNGVMEYWSNSRLRRKSKIPSPPEDGLAVASSKPQTSLQISRPKKTKKRSLGVQPPSLR